MLHVIIEQTYAYPMRMQYAPQTGCFEETGSRSLQYARNFTKPYGWIKESGTPPQSHHDCILMTDRIVNLGDEIAVKIIGVFMRADLDHKYVAVEESRPISDLCQLPADEMEELKRLYPRIGSGEGWFGREQALYCMEHHGKAL